MKKLLFMCVCGSFASPAAMAADPYEVWLTTQHQRGMEIEMIRVASEKALVTTDESDADVASILEQAEALEEEVSEVEDVKESS